MKEEHINFNSQEIENYDKAFNTSRAFERGQCEAHLILS